MVSDNARCQRRRVPNASAPGSSSYGVSAGLDARVAFGPGRPHTSRPMAHVREVTILADDLTGAADCAAAFAVAGMETWLSLDDRAGALETSVLAVDTDTRVAPADVAYARTAAAARDALRAGSRVVYKKIDSTLRGHVGPEIAATFAAVRAAEDGRGPRPIVLLCPAFPATGRILRAGRVLVNGTALEAVPAALLAMAGLSATEVGTAPDGDTLTREIERRAASGADAVVCDAESDDDLRTIAEAGARLARPVLWAGSGGLARHLPRALALRAHVTAESSPTDAPSRPILILVGSPSHVAQGQAAEIARQGDVTTIAVHADTLLAGEASLAWREAAGRIDGALAGGRDTCVVLERKGGSAGALDPALARAFGRLTARPGPIGTLIATGGETARAALEARGVTRLRVRAEVEPGIPACVTDGPPPLHVVTKAGGFGDAGALVRTRAALGTVPARSLVR